MKNLFGIIAAILMAVSCPVYAQSTNFFPGTQTIQEPNFPQIPVVITATAQTSAVLTMPPGSTLVVQAVGASLTTATFAIQGSLDGTDWLPLNISNTTAAGAAGTPALTVTQTTADAFYQVNIVGIPYVRTVSSGTFTGTSLTLNMVVSSRKGLQ